VAYIDKANFDPKKDADNSRDATSPAQEPLEGRADRPKKKILATTDANKQ
jgi:hypothetical protein